MYRYFQTKDTLKNMFSNRTQLFYIVEPADWSIKWDGKYITKQLNKSYNLQSQISSSRFALHNKILHFGSLNTFIKNKGIVKTHPSNKIVFTWFHVSDKDARIKYIKQLNTRADYIHTSCNITKNILINNGLKENKIFVIPIGVDLKLFRKFDKKEKNNIKKKLALPENKIIIGSFQKDGTGWGEGNMPKMIKGPDIFCDVVEKIAKTHDIHILLTGPARGYVKQRLAKAGIGFTHKFLHNYLDIVSYYNALDLYIVSSRAEGGPKAVTESMACGVPVVSTKVGMAADIIENNKNGFLSETEDVDYIVKNSIAIIENKVLKNRITQTAIEDVKEFSWEKITNQLYEKIYKNLL